MARKAYEGTKVSPEKTEGEIKKILNRYGARKTVTFYDDEELAANIIFKAPCLEGWVTIRIVQSMPDPFDDEKEHRRLWRVLLHYIKAKMTAIDSGLVELAQEFLPYIQLPDGDSVGTKVLTGLQKTINEGGMPKFGLLGDGK